MSPFRRFKLLPLLLLAGCTTTTGPIIPPSLQSVLEKGHQTTTPTADPLSPRQDNAALAVSPAPRVPANAVVKNPGPLLAPPIPDSNDPANITLNFEQLPLASFIRLVYGEILKKNIQLEESITKRKDLVTLRSGGPQTKAQIERATVLLLKSYGLAVIDVGNLVRILPDTANLGYLPEIRRGNALPEAPIPLRPQFHLIELTAVRNTEVASWIKSMFGTRVTLQEDTARNAVLLSGTPDNVSAAIDAIRVLDQPIMQGRSSIRISPRLWSVDDLAKRLFEVLSAEGYSVSPIGQPPGAGVRYPITLLPVPTVNSVLAFAQSDTILTHIENWARTLDAPNKDSSVQTYFTYQVLYKDAAEIATTLDRLKGARATSTAQSPATAGGLIQGQATGAAARSPGSSTAGQAAGVVVDESNNMLIFEGSAENFLRIRSLVQTLDRPTRSVVIEVTVAEVSLTDKFQFGVEWALKNIRPDGSGSTASTLGGTGIGSSGFNFRFLDIGGELRSIINGLASNNQASILSSPRLVARNGESATIQVGQEVPIITSQQSNLGNTGGANQLGVLQTVQYRSTGVILKVRPVIHSSDQISIDVTQEVSAAQSTNTGVSTSPTFGTRKLETKLTLKNGSTVLLGGLISSTGDTGDAGVPWLKDIPLLGHAFKTDSRNATKTELIVLITPYIINDDYEAKSLTNAFRSMLGPWANDPLSSPNSPAGQNVPRELPLPSRIPQPSVPAAR